MEISVIASAPGMRDSLVVQKSFSVEPGERPTNMIAHMPVDEGMEMKRVVYNILSDEPMQHETNGGELDIESNLDILGLPDDASGTP